MTNTKSKAPRTNIRWTTREQEAVAKEVVMGMPIDPNDMPRFDEVMTYAANLEVFRAAQLRALPDFRQRTLRTLGEVKLVMALIPSTYNTLMDSIHEEQEEKATRLEEERIALEEQQQVTESSLASVSIERLLAEVATRVASSMLSMITVAAEKAVADIVPSLPAAPAIGYGVTTPVGKEKYPRPVKKPHKPKVVIAGLLQKQANKIEEEFGNELDLYLWNTDMSPADLAKNVKNADYAIAITKHIGHPHEQRIIGNKSKSCVYTRHNGHVSTLRAQLLIYCDKHCIASDASASAASA